MCREKKCRDERYRSSQYFCSFRIIFTYIHRFTGVPFFIHPHRTHIQQFNISHIFASHSILTISEQQKKKLKRKDKFFTCTREERPIAIVRYLFFLDVEDRYLPHIYFFHSSLILSDIFHTSPSSSSPPPPNNMLQCMLSMFHSLSSSNFYFLFIINSVNKWYTQAVLANMQKRKKKSSVTEKR